MIAAASLRVTNVVTLGSVVVGILIALAGLAVFAYGVRWKAAWQVASTQADELRKALADERERGERLTEREREALNALADCKQTLSRLEQLPNLEHLLELMQEQALRSHEFSKEIADAADERAQRRLELGLERMKDLMDAHTNALAGVISGRPAG